MNKKMSHRNFFVCDSTWNKLKKISKKKDTSVSEVIRVVLDKFVKKGK